MAEMKVMTRSVLAGAPCMRFFTDDFLVAEDVVGRQPCGVGCSGGLLPDTVQEVLDAFSLFCGERGVRIGGVSVCVGFHNQSRSTAGHGGRKGDGAG
jgi:hypothetical protein